MTLTGLATEVRARNRSTIIRRVLAVVTMLGGAAVGALLVDHVRPSALARDRGRTRGRGTLATGGATRRQAVWQSA